MAKIKKPVSQNSTSQSDSNVLNKVKKKKKNTVLPAESFLNLEISKQSGSSTKPDAKIKMDNVDYKEIFSSLLTSYTPRTTPHIQGGKEWTSHIVKENEDQGKPIPLPIRKKLHELAEQIYKDDMMLYSTKSGKFKNSGYSQTMRKNVLSHGTTKDKIAAYTLQCMDAPLYSLKDLNSLIDLVSPKMYTQRLDAIDNLLNLFKNVYLPNGMVALEFECHNFKDLIPSLQDSLEIVHKRLVLWYFEDQLRIAFLKFVEHLDMVSHDTQPKKKLQGIKGIQRLIQNHFKQDSEIVLGKLVNKLGDTNRIIAGDTISSVSLLLASHPSLKAPLVSMIEDLLYRPNVGTKTQYNCLCILKDVLFERKDAILPERLCKLYFDFFKSCSQKGDVNNRFMAVIIRGLNRAYPFLKNKNIPFLQEQISSFYTMIHKVNFNISTQILQLLYQISANLNEETSNRFYNILYEKLFDVDFGPGPSINAFLNLVFKAMCKDTNKDRFCAFVRRLIQTVENQPPQVGCGVLFLVSEAIKDNSAITNFRDMGLNVFANDFSETNVSLKQNDSDDDDEYYPDLDSENDVIEQLAKDDTVNHSSSSKQSPQKVKKSLTKNIAKAESSWLHRENIKVENNGLNVNKYTINHRNPAYCGANLSPIWELSKASLHYHPTVSLFASTLLEESDIKYSGDPFTDFTLTRFLDRFIHRNPKTKKALTKHSETFGSRCNYVPKGIRKIPVDSETFRNLNQNQIPAEDMFCFNYFTEYRKEKKIEKQDSDDEGSIDDDEFEDYLKRIHEAKNFGLEDDEEIDFDFANNVNDLTTDDELVEDGEENHQEDDDDLFDELSDLDGDNDGNEEDKLELFDDNSDAEDMSFSEGSDGEDDMDAFEPKRSKGKKKSSNDFRNMLVDADEFSHLLEASAGAAGPLAGTSEAIFNADKSHSRQLQWEKKKVRETSFSKTKKNNLTFEKSSGPKKLKSKKPFKKNKNVNK